jgi:hypothetical protein
MRALFAHVLRGKIDTIFPTLSAISNLTPVVNWGPVSAQFLSICTYVTSNYEGR